MSHYIPLSPDFPVQDHHEVSLMSPMSSVLNVTPNETRLISLTADEP